MECVHNPSLAGSPSEACPTRIEEVGADPATYFVGDDYRVILALTLLQEGGDIAAPGKARWRYGCRRPAFSPLWRIPG